MVPVEAVLAGAGSRGMMEFGTFALRYPQHLKFVAVVEPDPRRRKEFAAVHKIPEERCFSDFGEASAKGRLAETLVNTTPDRAHFQITRAALEAGYHVFQEKPIAGTIEECLALLKLARKSDRMIQIAHCLRFTPFYAEAVKILNSGFIGTPMTMTYEENVGVGHMCHSYVRGTCGRRADSSPMLLAKSCHDLDILMWFAQGRKPERVSSFGSLSFYRPENAPAGAPRRCTDGCPAEMECPFSAIRIYASGDGPQLGYRGGGQWQVTAATTREERLEALKTGPFGRCVFHCGNDVVDHQVVNIEFEGGLTAGFSMNGFGAVAPKGEMMKHFGGPITGGIGRTFTIFGTRGVLHAPGYGHLEYTDFLTQQTHRTQTGFPEGGHGGGDYGVIRNFIDAVRSGNPGTMRNSLEEAIMSHIVGFAAEESRLNRGKVVEIDEYVSRF